MVVFKRFFGAISHSSYYNNTGDRIEGAAEASPHLYNSLSLLLCFSAALLYLYHTLFFSIVIPRKGTNRSPPTNMTNSDPFRSLSVSLSSTVVAVINCLRLTEVRIPNHTVRHTDAHLECHYDLDGEALYSVKFYKDGNEFYRYVPRDLPPVLIFNQTGVTVDVSTVYIATLGIILHLYPEERRRSNPVEGRKMAVYSGSSTSHLIREIPQFLQLHNSTDTLVVLKDVSLQSSGRYRCEVSAEAPSFQTVSDHGDMVVVALPEEGPKITGGAPRYQIGETVKVNCSSGRSKPATQLSWWINGEQVTDRAQLLPYPALVTGREGLETSTLGLTFQVRQKHFKKGDMKLKVSFGDDKNV